MCYLAGSGKIKPAGRYTAETVVFYCFPCNVYRLHPYFLGNGGIKGKLLVALLTCQRVRVAVWSIRTANDGAMCLGILNGAFLVVDAV